MIAKMILLGAFMLCGSVGIMAVAVSNALLWIARAIEKGNRRG